MCARTHTPDLKVLLYVLDYTLWKVRHSMPEELPRLNLRNLRRNDKMFKKVRLCCLLFNPSSSSPSPPPLPIFMVLWLEPRSLSILGKYPAIFHFYFEGWILLNCPDWPWNTSIVQASFEFTVFLQWPPNDWDERLTLPSLTWHHSLNNIYISLNVQVHVCLFV